MFRKPTILVIAASLTLLGASAASAAPLQGTPGAPGIGDPYFPLDGNGGYDVAQLRPRPEVRPPATDVLTRRRRDRRPRRRRTSPASTWTSQGLDGPVDHRRTGSRPPGAANGRELTVTPEDGAGPRRHVHGQGHLRRRAADHRRSSARASPASSTPTTARSSPASPTSRPRGSPPTTTRGTPPPFELSIAVPTGTEAISNGVLLGQDDRRPAGPPGTGARRSRWPPTW